MTNVKRSNAGFTLLELIITVSIAAILIAMATPAFHQQVETNSRRSLVADFITGMAYARAEAVKRGDDINLRTVSGGGSWQDGWCVTTENSCGVNDIRRFEAVDAVTFYSADKATSSFTFDSQGYLTSTSLSVSICQSNNEGKKITVTPLGQALAQDCTCSDDVCGS